MEYLIYAFVGLIIIALLLYNFSFLGQFGKKSKLKYEAGVKRKPITRHPQIDHSICIVCGSCIRACPETHDDDSPLGIVNGKIVLVQPEKCVGHATCETECPTGAMTVSLGELANDPNMPVLTKKQETVIPGIYIAGELSGVPLVKNAIEQGETVIHNIVESLKNKKGKKSKKSDKQFDVIIIGIGPSGLSATLAAHEKKLKYLTIEQGEIGGTVAKYPKQKMVMTSPVKIPLYGILKRKEIRKEELLDIWTTLVEKHKLNIHVGEAVESVVSDGDDFIIQTDKDKYKSAKVILCLGRRGTPRKLGIEGEDKSKVTYGLIDPDEYANKDILVVGGGDSAVEAAIALCENNTVTMSYRKEQFIRIKDGNAKKIKNAINKGKIKVFFQSQATEITDTIVTLDINGQSRELENDRVFIMIGGEPAFPLLRSIGVIKKI
ncbi:MAG: NAD(P)-binding domain-containing protein [Leptospirales bacterium]